MRRLTVSHRTLYRYKRPVAFGEHRLMFRPRDSHDLRLVDTALVISPRAKVRWLHDVFSNSIAIATFEDRDDKLAFESRIVIDHYGLADPNFPIEPYAQSYPFAYPAEEIPDLGRTMERHFPDPEHKVDAWVRTFLSDRGKDDTSLLLGQITRGIAQTFDYRRRYAIGVQSPVETLDSRSGTCRDLALLMMEGCRALGLAARFVSGYLYDPSADGPANDGPANGDSANGDSAPAQRQSDLRGSGDTHAWVQVYLPGAGWVEYDPTNGLIGGANLIRVAVAREPSQALPLQGSFVGPPDEFVDMTVEVDVSAKKPE